MRRFIQKRMCRQNYLSFMTSIFLNSPSSWESEINFFDSVECINATVPDYYDNFKINFYTLDINVHRLTNNSIFKCEPWMLFYKYIKNEKYFQCNFKISPDDVLKKFVSLNFNVNSDKSHRVELLKFIERNNINCYYSNIEKNIRLTEIPECYPNGYFKGRYDYGVPKEYFLGLIDIVTEGSNNMSTHFSEKSFKSIFYKKPFISIAGPYWYETFKKSGFELYDEIFDYSFDTNENKNIRLQNILHQIEQINLLNYSNLVDIIKNIQMKIEHNYNHLYSLYSKSLDNAYSDKVLIKV